MNVLMSVKFLAHSLVALSARFADEMLDALREEITAIWKSFI